MVRRLFTLAAIATLALFAPGCGSPSSPTPTPTPTPDKPSPGLSPELRAIVEDPKYASARWGVHVVDVATGEVLSDLRPTEKFLTGSTAKIFSVTAGLSILGADHRHETPVFRTGDVDSSGKLSGDLVLRGVGDLTLGGRTKADGTVDIPLFDHTDANALPGFASLTTEDPLAGLDDLARQVKSAGIKSVAGDVLVDDRLWTPVSIGDVPISPIVVNDNLVDIVLAPGASEGAAGTFEWRPKTAAYTLDVQVTTGAPKSDLDVTIAADPSSPRRIVVRAKVPSDRKPFVQTYQVPSPATFARALFIEALARAGVTVVADPLRDNAPEKLPAEDAVTKLPRVAVFVSPPFSEHGKLINKVSHNLGANLIPLLLAVKNGKRTYEEGMEIERTYVRGVGVDPALFTLVDGQGLPGNSFAPRGQTDFLRALTSRPEYRFFIESTPVLGVDGSLASVVPANDPARGHVFAKTGTLITEQDRKLVMQTKALAGYVDSAKGKRLAFALYLNDLTITRFPDEVLEANAALGKMASIIYRSN